MELLSKLKNKKPKVIFEADDFQVLNVMGESKVQQKDKIVCLPYFTDKNELLFRYTENHTFNIKRPEIDKFIKVLTTTINKDESPNDALKRDLEDKFGLILEEQTHVEILPPIYLSEDNTCRIYFCVLPLTIADYEQIVPAEDKKMKMKNNNVSVHINELKNIIVYDLITRYTIDLFKHHYSLF